MVKRYTDQEVQEIANKVKPEHIVLLNIEKLSATCGKKLLIGDSLNPKKIYIFWQNNFEVASLLP